MVVRMYLSQLVDRPALTQGGERVGSIADVVVRLVDGARPQITGLLLRLGRREVFLAMAAVAVATPLHGWLLLLMRQLRGAPVDWGGTTLGVIIPELLLNVILASLIYPVLRRLIARLAVDRLEW